MSAALFINVEVDQSIAGDAELAKQLAEVCPVDIFRAGVGGTGIEIVEDNLDECVLCQLCLNAAPANTIKVIKLYDSGAILGS